jgi:hypothetical protein
MTQEELDALMSGGVDGLEDESTPQEPQESEDEPQETDDDNDKKYDEDGYRIDANKPWPPPPPTDDHKVVHQLDDVTRDSELKAGELFDKLESVSSILMDMEGAVNDIDANLQKDAELFEKLAASFPHINSFKEALERTNESKEKVQSLVESCQMAGDETMMAMDGMQYQDIHRQKIERVINVMRALSKYMNSLFEGQIDDSKRVGSATHLDGDTTTENLVDNDDIEELIAALGKKG